MKNYIINNTMNYILKYNNYDKIKQEELKYGLVAIYLLVTKLIIILILAFLLGILKEVILFTIIYIPIRAVSFGLHATKSWICLIVSTLLFVGLPFVSKYLLMPTYIKLIIGIISILLMFKNSPADTHKRPIINENRRLFFKYFSVIIAIIYTTLSIFINNNFISNSLLLTLIIQCFITSPLVYKLFKLPYNNYKNFKFD
jgi:accessory gene regulator B